MPLCAPLRIHVSTWSRSYHTNATFEDENSPVFEESYVTEETHGISMASHARVEEVSDETGGSEEDAIIETRVAATLSDKKDNRIIADSGAQKHCMFDKGSFLNLTPTKRYRIRSVTGDTTMAEGVGDVQLSVWTAEGRVVEMRVHDVLYVPDLSVNLLPAGALDRAYNYTTHLQRTRSCIKFGQLTIPLRRESGLYYLSTMPSPNSPPPPPKTPPPSKTPPPKTTPSLAATATAEEVAATERTHRLMCHIGHKRLAQSQEFVDGMPDIKPPEDGCVCEGCVAGKMRLKNVCREPGTRAKEAFDLVHLDHKPMKVASVEGDTGFFMTDDKTRHICAFAVPSRNKVTECVGCYEQAMGKIKTLRSDGAKEFRYGKLEQYCIEHRIRQQFNAPYHRNQGGVVEHKVGILMALMTSIMADSGMPEEYWPYALDHAVRMYNITVTKAARLPDGRPTSPHYALYGKKASIKGLFLFGSAAFVHQRKEIRRGLQAKGKMMVMLGMAPRMKGTYRALDIDTKKVYETPEVIVDESRFPFKERRERMKNPTPAPWAHNGQGTGVGEAHGGRCGGARDGMGEQRVQINVPFPSTFGRTPSTASPSPTPPRQNPPGASSSNPPPPPPAQQQQQGDQQQPHPPSHPPSPSPSPPPAVVQAPPQEQPPQQQDGQDGQQTRGGGRQGLRRDVRRPKRDGEENYDFSKCLQRQVNIVRAEEESKMPTLQEYISKRAPQLHGNTILRRQHAQREWQEKINDRIRERLGKSPQKRYGGDAGADCASTH
ncbi:unnamed protein product [Vitrella brassicaformis CCMP3155]|uniref:Integrase catalytic domain-containing protein n=1 Tax=Vitrella brassicaformis (strain CCMP3155) TaxID=1169540 RepID=A0A0G4GRH8_VITBC|nr:unnamed protein product [Vitrella brassicaformis CCMP3155]|eukprot:CEM33133.1 unnamed protein product [Vitrella brassicaformis CCMP3155]